MSRAGARRELHLAFVAAGGCQVRCSPHRLAGVLPDDLSGKGGRIKPVRMIGGPAPKGKSAGAGFGRPPGAFCSVCGQRSRRPRKKRQGGRHGASFAVLSALTVLKRGVRNGCDPGHVLKDANERPQAGVGKGAGIGLFAGRACGRPLLSAQMFQFGTVRRRPWGVPRQRGGAEGRGRSWTSFVFLKTFQRIFLIPKV